MLAGAELKELRTRVFGADVSRVSEEQLKALAAYQDRLYDPGRNDTAPPCAYCDANESIGEFAAERLDDVESDRLAAERGRPEESDGSVLVKGDFICRRCLASELPALRKRLSEIHWIELAFMKWQPTAIVITSEAELDPILAALQR